MHAIPEISIDLTAQELSDPSLVTPIEVDDVGEFAPLPTPRRAANTGVAPEPATADETIEIELTAEQMDAMLTCPLRLGEGRLVTYSAGPGTDASARSRPR